MKGGILGNLYILLFDFLKWTFILGHPKKESGTLKLGRREYFSKRIFGVKCFAKNVIKNPLTSFYSL